MECKAYLERNTKENKGKKGPWPRSECHYGHRIWPPIEFHSSSNLSKERQHVHWGTSIGKRCLDIHRGQMRLGKSFGEINSTANEKHEGGQATAILVRPYGKNFMSKQRNGREGRNAHQRKEHQRKKKRRGSPRIVEPLHQV